MNWKFLVLLILGIVGIATAGLSISDTSVSADPFKPGQSGTIQVTIGSTLQLGVTGTAITGNTISATTLNIDASNYFVLSSQVYIGDIDPGGSTVISVPIKVKDYTPSGNYVIRFEAIGYIKKASGADQLNKRTATIVVNVLHEPILSLDSSKETISEKDTIDLTINNQGGKITGLRIKTEGDISLLGKDELYIGDLDDSTTVTVNLDSRNAVNGPVDVAFVLTYSNELGTEVTETKTLRLSLKKDDIDLIFIQLSDVITNRNSVLTWNIKNTGNDIEDLVLSFSDENIKAKEVTEVKIGDLKKGEEKEVSVHIFADLTPGTNYVDLYLEWKENGESENDNIEIPLRITSDADVGVYLEAKPTPLSANTEHTISILVSNLGSYSIEAVNVKVDSEAFNVLDVQKEAYIGGLQTDDFSTVQFKIMTKSAGDYPVNITIEYKDQSGEWKIKELSKNITIYESEAGDRGVFYFLIVLVIIAGAVWYFKFRKKKVDTRSGLKSKDSS